MLGGPGSLGPRVHPRCVPGRGRPEHEPSSQGSPSGSPPAGVKACVGCGLPLRVCWGGLCRAGQAESRVGLRAAGTGGGQRAALTRTQGGRVDAQSKTPQTGVHTLPGALTSRGKLPQKVPSSNRPGAALGMASGFIRSKREARAQLSRLDGVLGLCPPLPCSRVRVGPHFRSDGNRGDLSLFKVRGTQILLTRTPGCSQQAVRQG